MPTYDYYSEKTKEIKEVFHGMNEEPEILDSKGNKMKKIISSGADFKIENGGTRRRSWKDRHGHKKTENQATPSESAAAKASEAAKNIGQDKASRNDPYHAFRD